MFPSLARLLLTALVSCLPLAALAEPPARRESNVSVRNEVQIAIDKALAHLQETQRADGTWGKLGTTGFVLMGYQRDPRRLDNTLAKSARFEGTIEKGYAALRRGLPEKGDLQKVEDFETNVPPALLALRFSGDDQDRALLERGHRAIGVAPVPKVPETRALFLAIDPKNRAPGEMPSPVTGSALAAWVWSVAQHSAHEEKAHGPVKPVQALANWLQAHYTLARNPEGDGVHQFYFWLSNVLGQPTQGVSPDLKLPTGQSVDMPQQLAERLINDQNGNGSWSGVGEHWTERDPDLVTAMCVLTLEQVYRQL